MTRQSGNESDRGLTLVECVIALALLAVVLAMSMLVLVRQQDYLRRTDERIAATRAAEYEIETLLAKPFDQLLPREARPATTKPAEIERLPEGAMRLWIVETGIPRLRRIRVEVSWKGDRGHPVAAEALAFGGAGGSFGGGP